MKYCIWTIVSALLISQAIAGYESPNPRGLGVDSTSISIPESTRKSLATALAKACGNVKIQNLDLIEKLVAISLLVSPQNRDAVVLDARLKKGESLSPDTKWSTQKTAVGLTSLGNQLKSGNKAEQRLAGYFFALACALDPKNDDTIYALATYERVNGAVDWSGIHGAAAATLTSTVKDAPNRLTIKAGVQATGTSEASIFQNNQAKVNGLVVRDLGATLSGDLLEIVITILPWHVPNVTRLEFSTPVGNEMNVSFNEAISLLRMRHPNLPGGKTMRISFDDKYTPKDGGSAGLAFCLLGFSLLDGLELDPEVAVTGDITVDWLVRGVGGIHAKIDGARRAGKTMVIIPSENITDLEDMILLSGVEPLLKTQIFAVENVTQAIEIIRKDRTGKLQAAIDEFSKLGAALESGRTLKNLMVNRAARNIATKVAVDAPQNASARYLTKMQNGWKPQKLSLEGSLSEISALLWPYGGILKRYGSRQFDLISDEVLIESMIRANQLNQYTDPKIKSLAKSLYNLVYAHADYRESKPDASKFQTELRKHRAQLGDRRFRAKVLKRTNSSKDNLLAIAYRQGAVVTTELRKLSANHHFLEALLR